MVSKQTKRQGGLGGRSRHLGEGRGHRAAAGAGVTSQRARHPCVRLIALTFHGEDQKRKRRMDFSLSLSLVMRSLTAEQIPTSLISRPQICPSLLFILCHVTCGILFFFWYFFAPEFFADFVVMCEILPLHKKGLKFIFRFSTSFPFFVFFLIFRCRLHFRSCGKNVVFF